MEQIACLSCGKRFTPWRGKKYCSEECRKRAENRRLRAKTPDAPDSEKIYEQNQVAAGALRGDESPAFIVRNSEWMACNEVTDKFVYKDRVIGWTMRVENFEGGLLGWFGRVGREMSFGPSTRERARKSVEAFLKGEDFGKTVKERSWRGDCWSLIGGQ